MRIRRLISILTVACVLASGQTALAAAETPQQAAPQKAAPAKPGAQKAAPKKDAPKKDAKKGQADESPEALKDKLDVVGKKLVQDAAKNVTPSVRAKAVSPEDKEFVARYVEVDTDSLTTEVRPATGSGGKYIGVIKYLENQYECRGKSKEEALKAPCSMVKSRRMNELIRYEGKWIF